MIKMVDVWDLEEKDMKCFICKKKFNNQDAIYMVLSGRFEDKTFLSYGDSTVVHAQCIGLSV